MLACMQSLWVEAEKANNQKFDTEQKQAFS